MEVGSASGTCLGDPSRPGPVVRCIRLQDMRSMLAPGSPVHVQKLKPGCKLDYAWDGAVLRCDASGIVLRAEFNVEVVEREWATFRRGDVFVEFYYFDRWFNI